MEKEWDYEENQLIENMLKGKSERELLKIKYPGISDDLLNKILIDDNPQRKAEVLATMDEYLKLRELKKSESEAYDIITESFKRKKQASGGRVPFISGGDAEDYGELIDAYEAGIDVMPGETLTDYINRIRKAEKRRKNKASGGLAYMLGE